MAEQCVFYQFKVMAYGYSPAVEVVTRLFKPVKAYLLCWEKFQFALSALQLCGWNIQHKKTVTYKSPQPDMLVTK